VVHYIRHSSAANAASTSDCVVALAVAAVSAGSVVFAAAAVVTAVVAVPPARFPAASPISIVDLVAFFSKLVDLVVAVPILDETHSLQV
jgi:hypothetical protein